MTRREAREAAFQLVFQMEFQKELSADTHIALAVESRELESDDYLERLVMLVAEKQVSLDQKITAHLNKWRLERLPKVTLALLRLAVCELDSLPDIPIGVTINEVVELAKQYASEEDAAYLNGVLGSYVRATPPHKETEQGKDDTPCPDA